MRRTEITTRRARQDAVRKTRKRRNRLGLAVVLVGGLGIGSVAAAGPALAWGGPFGVFGHHEKAVSATHGSAHSRAVHARLAARMRAAAAAKSRAHSWATTFPSASTAASPSASATAIPSATSHVVVRPSAAPTHSATATPSASASATATASASPSPSASGSAKSDAGSASYGRYGKPLDVNPQSLTAQARSAIAAASAGDRSLLAKITRQPIATWFGDGVDITNKVRTRVASASTRTSVPTLVMYNIPRRDCGAYSTGGAPSATAYRSWVDQFVAGMGSTKSIVVVEPDGLALMTCLSATEQSTRESLIKYAVDRVAAQGSWVYIDAGSYNYQTVPVISGRLEKAGVDGATGFALNVSGFQSTKNLLGYGDQVAAKVGGGAHYVLDTSRNGVAPAAGDYSWCNPLGRGLGPKPTTRTGSSLADAYLFIKPPGESDGPCNGGPGPGGWFQSYALMLAKNAAF
jgi:endoglucanase